MFASAGLPQPAVLWEAGYSNWEKGWPPTANAPPAVAPARRPTLTRQCAFPEVVATFPTRRFRGTFIFIFSFSVFRIEFRCAKGPAAPPYPESSCFETASCSRKHQSTKQFLALELSEPCSRAFVPAIGLMTSKMFYNGRWEGTCSAAG